MTQGVIFDFNGTLFFDSAMHADAWKRFCREKFGFVPTDEEIAARYLGRNNLEILADLLGKNADPARVDALAKEKEALYRQICREMPEDFHLTKGAAAFFDTLRAKGVPMFIASGSEYENMAFYMEELGISRWFDWAHIVYDDHTLPGKPAPDVYLKTARQMGLAPENLTVFEDSRSGIASALAAGIGQVFALVPEGGSAYASALPGVKGVLHDFTNAFALL